jgi:lipoprotein NlpI
MNAIRQSGGPRAWRATLTRARWGVLALLVACDSSSRDAAAFTSAGVTHLQMKEYDRAIRDFDRALAIQPGFVVAWRQRGLAHTAKGDYHRAVADYEHALVLAPNDTRLLTERGEVYVLLNDFPDALQDFDRAISLKPDHAATLERRGRTHFILGNFAQAAADLERGLSVSTPEIYPVLWLHLARQRLAQDDSRDFAAHAAAMDSVHWPAPLARYFLGRLQADSLRRLAVVADSAFSASGCLVPFYLAEHELLRGRRDSAAALFAESRAACPRELGEHKAAVAELRRLGR